MARMVKYQSRKAFLEPTVETMNALEDAIQWSSVYVPRKMRFMMNELVFHMAIINQGFARKMSFGPYDPSGMNESLAWRSPDEGIRRITQRYYLGWKVRQIKPAVWQLYNDSREAYYIEFGIHTSVRRIRRPVRKLSLRKTMDFMMRTNVWHRVWVDIYVNPKYEHSGRGFRQHVSGPGKGGLTGQLHGARVIFSSPLAVGRKLG